MMIFTFPYIAERTRSGLLRFTVCYDDARRMTDFILREEREA
jgi:hypothetical protein